MYTEIKDNRLSPLLKFSRHVIVYLVTNQKKLEEKTMNLREKYGEWGIILGATEEWEKPLQKKLLLRE